MQDEFETVDSLDVMQSDQQDVDERAVSLLAFKRLDKLSPKESVSTVTTVPAAAHGTGLS
jgi:hypothetical protein